MTVPLNIKKRKLLEFNISFFLNIPYSIFNMSKNSLSRGRRRWQSHKFLGAFQNRGVILY